MINQAPSASRPWYFLLAAVGSSWTFWWLAVALGGRISHSLSTLMLIAGVLCIPVSALYFVFGAQDVAASREYWHRIFDVRRLSVGGILIAVVVLPGLACVAAVVDGFSKQRMPNFALLHGLVLQPVLILKALGFGLVVAPFLEEMGWRGYALKPLQAQYGALAGALMLACVHAAWHLPLFFLAGTYQDKLGILTVDFWRFMVSVAAFDVIAAALFGAMKESALAAILFHFSFNLAGMLFDLSPVGTWSRDAFTVALSVIVIFGTRGRLRMAQAYS